MLTSFMNEFMYVLGVIYRSFKFSRNMSTYPKKCVTSKLEFRKIQLPKMHLM
jgi:hypothetical protein